MMELISQTNDQVNSPLLQSPAIPQPTGQPLTQVRGEIKAQRKISVDVLTLVQNAKVLMKHNECSLAVQLLREALQKDSKNSILLRTMAQGLDALARFAEAEKILSVLCIQEVSFPNLVMKAHNYYKLGNDELAKQSYFEALALVTDDQPELFEVYKNMGNIFVRQGDFESAEENYNKAYTRCSESDVLLVNYGTLEVQKGDLDKALFCFRKAVQVNALNDRAWVGLGMVHSQFGDAELAWGNMIKAADINPLNRTALILLAQWSVTFQKTESVSERLIQFVSEYPDDTDMSVLLIKLFLEKGDDLRAHLEFTKALCFQPRHQELLKLLSYFHGVEVAA